MLALREEWEGDHEGNDFRPRAGYGKMVDFLVDEIRRFGGDIKLSHVAKEIVWKNDNVTVTTADGKIYEGHKIIITVPVGILQSKEEITGNITFSPPVPDYLEQVQKIGFGSVIKVIIEFTERFWETSLIKHRTDGKDLNDAAFIFSKEKIPTWWTKSPEKSCLLTGWLGGPKAKEISILDKNEIFNIAILSLTNIFGLDETVIRHKIKAWDVANWNNDPYTRGSYSYPTIGVNEARMKMAIPKEHTIYFAGEAMYQGPEAGTVEAALGSGKAVADSIINPK